MAVVSANMAPGADGSLDDRLQSRYRTKWVVVVNSRLDDAAAVRDSPYLPAMFDPYTGPNGQVDARAILISKQATQRDDPYVWDVSLQYASIERLKTMRMTWCQDQRPLLRDFDGLAVVNSARSMFDPPQMRDYCRPCIVVQRFEQTFSFAVYAAYADVVNEDEWFGFPAGSLKMTPPSVESVYQDGSFGWMVSYEFHFRDIGWDALPLDAGYRSLDADGVEREIFDPTTGHLAGSPVLLNGAGKLLRDARTNLVGAHDAAATLLEISDTDFDDFGFVPYEIKIEDEVCRVIEEVTAPGSEKQFRVVRGVAGTTAVAHGDGVNITQEPVYLRFRQFRRMPFADLNLL